MREKILAMEAGEELDILVAEKVMEHKLGWYTDYGFKKEYERRVIALENNRYSHIPHYSTDIHAAWEIRDRMFEQPIPIRNKFIEDTNYDIFHINPMMICKAALLAVMGE